MAWVSNTIAVLIIVITAITSEVLAGSIALLDKLPQRPSSENIVQGLLQQYEDQLPKFRFEDSPLPDTSSSSGLEGIRDAIRRRFDLYIRQVKEVHGLEDDDEEQISSHLTLRRQKRAVITADTALPGRRRRNITQQHDTAGIQVVRVVYPLNPQPFSYQKLSDLNNIQTKGESYLFGLEITDSGAFTCIYRVGKDLKLQLLVRQLTTGAIKVEVCQIDSQIYVLPVEYNETSTDPIDIGSNLFLFDATTMTLLKQQTIDTRYATAVHFWTGTGEEANDVYLAVAPKYSARYGKRSYEVDVAIYRWHSGYFDYVYSLTAYSPQSISHAGIMSRGYLAIANYQDDSGSTSVYSEIFRYNHKESKYLSFQKIRTQGAKSIEFFGFTTGDHEDHFLAIANHCETDHLGKRIYGQKSHIFKYGLDRFIPFQTFETYGAFQFLSVKMESKSFLVLGEISGVRIFQYNGWKFTETYKLSRNYKALNPNLINFRSLIHRSEPYFTIASSETNVESGVYALEFQHRNDYNEMASEFGKECRKALARVDAENMPLLIEEVEKAPKVSDHEILLESSIEFGEAAVLKSTVAEALFFTDVSFDDDTSIQLARRSSQIQHGTDELEFLKEEARHVVRRNENRSINAKIEFENVGYDAKPLKAANVATLRLNGNRLNDSLSKLIYLGKDNAFRTVEIDSLITDQHIDVNKLNGDAISDFALTSSSQPQVFHEKNKFSGSVRIQSALTVNGVFDGVELKTIDFLLKKGNQTFTCDLNIQDSFVGNLMADTVNQVDLEYYLSEGVLRNTPVRISGEKHFENLHVSSLHANQLSGFFIEELFDKAILANGKVHQTFTSRETSFESIHIEDLKLMNAKLNDRWVLDDFVSISNGRYEMDSVEFFQRARVGRLNVGSLVNKIRVDDEGDLDLILKDSSKVQKVANKSINVLHLEKDSSAHGLVDGVNLTGWSNEKRLHLSQDRLRVGIFAPTGSLRIEEGIFIEKFGRFVFQGEDVTRLLQNALLLNATELPSSFRGIINFETVKVLGDSALRSINRIPTSDWLTTDAADTAIVRGKIAFVEKVTFTNSISANGLYHTYNTYNRGYYVKNEEVLEQLNDVLIDGRNQTVQRNSIFEALLVIEKLYCPAINILLEGIPFSNVLLANVDQSVEGRVKFLKPVRVSKSFHVTENVQTTKLCGYDMHELCKDTLMTKSLHPQVFKAGAKFDGGLSVHTIKTDEIIGGYNTTQLLSNIVRKDLSAGQIVYGSLKFLDDTELKYGLIFSGSLNGISDEEWGHGFLLTSSSDHQVVHTPLRFKGGLAAFNLTVANAKVSSHNVQQLAKEILRIDQGGFLGTVYFTNTLIADIRAKFVNGFDLPNDILWTTGKTEQIVTSAKTFLNGWEVEGDLSVQWLAGIDYNKAAEFALGNTLATDNLRIEGTLVVRKEPYFQAKFNGVEWRKLLNQIWWADETVTIPKQRIFDVLTVEAGATIEGLFSGIDLTDLEKNYLSRTKDKKISAYYVFTNELTFHELKLDHLELEGRLTGLDVKEFRDTVFLHGFDQEIDFKQRFDELTISNLDIAAGTLVGGNDLNKDVMLLHGSNVFQRVVRLESLTADDLVIGNYTTINGIHLTEWLENSLIGNEGAEITGRLEFYQARFNKNLQVLGHIDGIMFDEAHVLTVSGDQTVQGLTTFRSTTHVKDIFVKSGVVNGRILHQLVDSLVLQDRGTGSITVSGEKTFLHLVKADSVVTESLFQGYNINETLSNLKPEAYLSSYFNESLEERYKGMAALALDLHRVADRQGVFLDHYELSGRYDLPAPTGKATAVRTVSFGRETTLFVSSFNGQISTSVLWWGTYSASLDLLYECSFKGIIRGFAGIRREVQMFLVVSLSSQFVDGTQPVEAFLDAKIATKYGELEKSSGKLSRTFVLKWDVVGAWVIHQIIHAWDFGAVVSFQLVMYNGHVRPCVVTLAIDDSTKGRAVVLCFSPQPPEVSTKYSNDTDGIEIFQVLPIAHPHSTFSAIRALTTTSKTFLAIAVGEIGSEVVDIWIHSDTTFVKVSCIPAVFIQSIALTESSGGQVLMAIATAVKVDEKGQGGRVYIYRYSERNAKFEKIQSLHFFTVQSVDFQSFHLISSATELLYVHTRETVYVHAYKGFAGFVREHSIPTSDSNMMETSATIWNGTFKAELLVTSPTEIQVYRAKLAGISLHDHQSQSLEENVASY